ncbi:DUF4145 domain-containing protein [Rhizobium ruizarguesonis]|uniref:DUF4145 domain-containing protein n=1 Tax=Rhizobium ruizarguesonis TaxID=2081791 RepID=UPI002962098D|nr:DUF4145 domain-containing protein [Rhizobium ruizarguesonis]
MERALWTKSYSTFGRFTCPRCNRGKLREGKTPILREEPDHITRELQYEGLIGEVSAGRFAGILKCNSKGCGEMVAVAGDYRTDYERQQDHQTGDEVLFSIHSYTPFCIRPAPAIISFPKVLDKDIKPHMLRAFDLFWSDHGSCANRLRIIVEMVLDQLGVPREGPKGKWKRTRWDLADRITALDLLRPGHEEILNALRVVGNTGSHDGIVDFEDLLDSFELLEYALIELLERRREGLGEKARRLIQGKGKPAP